uniref:cytochrome b n=1 Tax=Sphingobium sp. TaxID=1912891 RepID=UPI003B3B1CC6
MARYTAIARALHWIIAALIVANLFIGFAHDALPKDWAVVPVHKSIGLTVLALTLVWIVWRLTHRAPPLPVAMPAWEKGAAHATHFLFYALMLVLPLSGWIMVSAGTRPLHWFFLFDVPKFAVEKGDAIVGLSRGAHELLPW